MTKCRPQGRPSDTHCHRLNNGWIGVVWCGVVWCGVVWCDVDENK